MARLTETTLLSDRPEFDAESGLLRDAKLCGITSRNGRRYPIDVLQKASELYARKKIYAEHRAEGQTQGFDDWVGETLRVTVREDGIYGDVQFLVHDARFPKIAEAIEKCPRQFGFSHVAEAVVDQEADGTDRVAEIVDVLSVDLVTDPATTQGIFESKHTANPEPKTMALKIGDIVNSTVKTTPLHGLLREQVETGEVPPAMEVEVADTASPEEQVKAALLTAIMAKLEAASQEQLAGVMKALGMEDSITDNAGAASEKSGGESGESGEGGGSDDESKAAEERFSKLERKAALLESENLLRAQGIEPKPALVEAVAATDAKHRKALVENMTQGGGGGGGGQRPDQSPPAFDYGHMGGGSDDGGGSDYANRFEESLKRARARKGTR